MKTAITKAILYSIQWPLFVVSLVVPRSKKVWVFGSWYGYRYADNSQYVYDYVAENELDIRAVWLSKNEELVRAVRKKGREAYLANSPMGFWLGCRAGLTFITCGNNDVNSIGIFRSKVVQLWHGTPLKKIKFDDKFNASRPKSKRARLLQNVRQFLFPFMDERCDIIISPSHRMTERLSTAFQLPLERIPVTGYPRGDVILAPATREELGKVIPLTRNAAKVLLYAPTHRGEGKGSYDVFETLDIATLERFLQEHNAVLLLKMHYYHKSSPKLAAREASKTRVVWLSEEDFPDINRLLPFTDVLITDYSSVYFDYLLLNRPIIFTPFDLESYITKERELYEDYSSATPGIKCKDWDSTVTALATVLNGDDEFESDRLLARDKYNDFIDTNNCLRVIMAARSLLNETSSAVR